MSGWRYLYSVNLMSDPSLVSKKGALGNYVHEAIEKATIRGKKWGLGNICLFIPLQKEIWVSKERLYRAAWSVNAWKRCRTQQKWQRMQVSDAVIHSTAQKYDETLYRTMSARKSSIWMYAKTFGRFNGISKKSMHSLHHSIARELAVSLQVAKYAREWSNIVCL